MADHYLLLSGGIDSLVCLEMLWSRGDSVHAVFIDFHQAAADLEWNSATKLTEYYSIPLTKVSVDLGKQFGEGEVVGRNLFLISSTLPLIGTLSASVVIGIHSGTNYPDTKPDFIEATRSVVGKISSGRVVLIAPLLEWTKPEILGYALQKNLPLWLTYSCEKGLNPPCGECLSCIDRKEIAW